MADKCPCCGGPKRKIKFVRTLRQQYRDSSYPHSYYLEITTDNVEPRAHFAIDNGLFTGTRIYLGRGEVEKIVRHLQGWLDGDGY
jgi:hypothetical protein